MSTIVYFVRMKLTQKFHKSTDLGGTDCGLYPQHFGRKVWFYTEKDEPDPAERCHNCWREETP